MIKLSTKQRREIYSISSLLLHLLVFAILLFSLNSCTQKEEAPEPSCDTVATVKDLRGLDGCGFVLVLENGQKLRPYYPPVIWGCFGPVGPVKASGETTPIQNFTLKDGQQVTIGFTNREEEPNTCMTGKLVNITCITEVVTENKPAIQAN